MGKSWPLQAVTASHQRAESGQCINTWAPRRGATSRPPWKPARIVLSGPGPKLLGWNSGKCHLAWPSPHVAKLPQGGRIGIAWNLRDWPQWTIVNPPIHKHGTSMYLGLLYLLLVFPDGSDSKESTCNAGDLGLTPGLEDPLEKGKATHSIILAWRIPWTV